MNINQIHSIQHLTNYMLDASPYHVRKNIIFKIEVFNDGYAVHCFNCPYQSHWTDSDFQAFAVVGPRGGIKGYRVLRK